MRGFKIGDNSFYELFTFFCVPTGYLAGLLVHRVFGNTYWHLSAVEAVGFAGTMAGGVMMSTWGVIYFRKVL